MDAEVLGLVCEFLWQLDVGEECVAKLVCAAQAGECGSVVQAQCVEALVEVLEG